MDAQRRMSCSSVLIYGLTGLGVEVSGENSDPWLNNNL